MSNQPPRQAQRHPKKVYLRRRWGLVLGLMLLVMVPLIVWADVRWNKPLTAGLAPAATTVDTKKFTVLLLGADDRPGEPGRSDTMLLGFVDLNAGSVKLLSVPRDSYVNIPGHGADKINAAYAFGQEQLTKKTVEQMIGQPIDYTFVVNMQGFQDVVDTVGGVDINVDEDMNYDDPYDMPTPLHIHLTKGPHHLNGLDALHYVRFRHDAQSDWGRMARQQNFLKALLHEVKKPQNIAKLPQLLSLAFDPNVIRTNLSPSQLTQLAGIAKDKLGDQSIASQTLQGDDWWSSEGYYLVLKFAEMRNTIHQLAGQTVDDKMKAQDDQDAAAYAAVLTQNGYSGAKAATATGSNGSSGSTETPKTPAAPGTTTGGKGTGTTGGSAATGTTTPGTTTPGTGGQNSGSPGAGSVAGAAGASNSGTTAAGGSTTPPPTTETPQSPDAGPPWPLVVVDGSGGTGKALIAKLEAEGYHVVSVQQVSGIQRTTIVWYNGSAQAYYHLQALLPNATPKHMTPGSGDPPLKLILGADAP